MRIHFATAALRRLCNDTIWLRQQFGAIAGGVVGRRLTMLALAPTLAHISTAPPDRRRAEVKIGENAYSVCAAEAGRIIFAGFAGGEASCVPAEIDTIIINEIGGA